MHSTPRVPAGDLRRSKVRGWTSRCCCTTASPTRCPAGITTQPLYFRGGNSHRRADHGRARPRRRPDALLPDRREVRHPRRARGGRGHRGRHGARVAARRAGGSRPAPSSSTSGWWRSDDGAAPDDDRQHLVVIGNGMAGARAVEEILARGGAERFRITMFGDEPYGNYNRIMLSHVLAGEDAEEIYLNPLGWYADNDITLYAGVRVVRIDRFARKVFANDGTILGYDKLIIATGSRTFFPPMDGMWVDDKTLTPGVFGFRTLDDTNAMLEYAQRAPAGGRDRRWAARAGGGVRAAAARARGARRAVRAGADEPAARRGGRSDPAQGRRAAGHHGAHSASGPPRCAAPARSAGSCSATARRSTATWSCSPRASGPTWAWASSPVSPWNGRSSPTTRCGRSTTPTSTRSGSARSTAARCTGWSRRCGNRPPCSPTTSPAPTRRRPTTARGSPRSSRSPGSTWHRWASSTRRRRTTSSSGSPSRAAASTSRW